MASSQTPNLGLVEYGDRLDSLLRNDYNGNLTKIDNFAGQTDDSISAVQNGLAYIVGNTNTTGSTLAVGQFVYVKGHSTIAEGLRKVTSSISANGSITTSNTDACSEGGLNALNSKIKMKEVPSGVTTLLGLIGVAPTDIPTTYRQYSPSFTDYPSALSSYTYACFITVYNCAYPIIEVVGIDPGSGIPKCVHGYKVGSYIAWDA